MATTREPQAKLRRRGRPRQKEAPTGLVRRNLLIDPKALEELRQYYGTKSDSETVRAAIDVGQFIHTIKTRGQGAVFFNYATPPTIPHQRSTIPGRPHIVIDPLFVFLGQIRHRADPVNTSVLSGRGALIHPRRDHERNRCHPRQEGRMALTPATARARARSSSEFLRDFSVMMMAATSFPN